MSRVLIFGGTFNPVHVGHLRLAVEAAEALAFARIEMVPSFAPRHKDEGGLLPFGLRLMLLRAALEGHAGFAISDIEKDLPIPSVTQQTIEAMTRNAPETELHFLVGDREFLRLHKWIRGRDVAALAHIVIAARTVFELEAFASAVLEAWPGSRRMAPPEGMLLAFELLPGRSAVVLPVPRLEISSSLVRRRWLQGRSLAHLLPAAAIDVLEWHRPEVEAVWGAQRGKQSSG